MFAEHQVDNVFAIKDNHIVDLFRITINFWNHIANLVGKQPNHAQHVELTGVFRLPAFI
jgi:hypothetical protein